LTIAAALAMSPASAIGDSLSPRQHRAAANVGRTLNALAIGRSKFYEMVRDGEIRIVKVGRRTLIHVDELRRVADALAEQSTAK